MNSRLKPESGLGTMWKRDKIELTYSGDFVPHRYGVTPGSWWVDVLT